ADIGVLGIAPELPIFIGRQLFGIEPHGTADALAHLGAGGCRDQRRRQTEKSAPVGSPSELDAADNVAPLVGTADLQLAAEAPRQLDKVIRLQDRIIELEKTQ